MYNYLFTTLYIRFSLTQSSIMEEKEKKSKSNKYVAILSLLLLLSFAFNLYQLKNNADRVEQSEIKITGLEEQYDDIDKLYKESMAMVDTYKAENLGLNEDLETKVNELKSLKLEIENLKRTVKDKSKLEIELNVKYKKILALNADLENRIDDLLVENKTLFEKNESLKENINVVTDEKNALGEKVQTGAKLKAEYFAISSFKKRSSGKFKETKLAKRANKFEVAFTLLDNAIAEKGEKTVYLRIVAPTGKVVGNPIMGSDVFNVEGLEEEQKYSVKKVYTSTGEKQEMVLSYLEEELRFETGDYVVEIYVDNYLAGKSIFSLK